MYALNTGQGTLKNDSIGELPSGIAIPITPKQASIAKHLVGVVVFDRVAGINEEKAFKGLYGLDPEKAQFLEEPTMTYQEFIKKHADNGMNIREIAPLWVEYKLARGIEE